MERTDNINTDKIVKISYQIAKQMFLTDKMQQITLSFFAEKKENKIYISDISLFENGFSLKIKKWWEFWKK